MMEIYYLNSKGKKIYLDRAPYKMLSVTSLFDYEWTKDKVLKRSTSKRDIDIVVSGENIIDYHKNISNLVSDMDIDAVDGNNGRLYIGDCYILCYISKSKKSRRYINAKQSVITFSVVPDGAWLKETPIQFRYAFQEIDNTGKRYPYNYPYNYGLGGGYNSAISLEAFGSMDFIITIYGYAHNPEICIGENTYKVDYTIQPGEVLRIDSKNHTVILTKTNGVTLSLFRYRGIRSYIFEKITSGEHPVYWNGDFDWDILLLEERSEPKWT